MRWWIFLILFIACIIYVIVGGAIFSALERSNEETVTLNTNLLKKQFLASYPCMSEDDLETFVQALLTAYDQGILVTNTTKSKTNWDLASAIYFSVTVVTTIGYGNIAPSTSGGQIFCIFYAILGIPLFLTLFVEIGSRQNNIIQRLDSKWCNNGRLCIERPKLVRTARFLGWQCICFVLFVSIPAVIFRALEDGWTYGNSVYYAIISLTTIGFGDFVAAVNYTGQLRGLYRLLVAVWLVLGIAWMAGFISSSQSLYTELFTKTDQPEKHQESQANDEIKNYFGRVQTSELL